ncbi:MAG TPA: lysophospholipid acyltransferase family protein [Aeromicrobium sp.]|nr:lysophospholipid acyltransferase family protein [Aeromicrobium sp.]HKY57906.1 lysophospholipid acyltransferase family protein [Aeromicrobium sp.]
MGKLRPPSRRLGLVWQFNRAVIKPLLFLLSKRDWRDADRIPQQGGAILVLNHISHIDPLLAGLLAWDCGRIPRFLAKSSLFGRSRLLDWWLIGGGQVPVDRSSGAAGFQAAIDVVNAGDLLVVYVEGSITKDPTGWPMRPKTGAARIALITGAPVIPVGQWGAQELLPPYSRRLSLKRPHIHFSVGHEVNLIDLVGRAGDPDAVREATDRIMSAIVERVEDLRGQKAPADRYDPLMHGQSATGRPNNSRCRR